MNIGKKNKRIFIITFGILLMLSVFLLRKQLLTLVGNYLFVKDELYPADVIHVIAGDDYRTEYAIELFKQGYGKYIFFTGGWCRFHGYYHGEHGQELALSEGIPVEAIAFDDTPVTSTYEESSLLKKWIEQNPLEIKSVIVVSDPFHMRRVKWTDSHLMGKTTSLLMAPVPFEQTEYKNQWWDDIPSMYYVRDEYIKLMYYFLRYQLSIEWLARFDTD